MLQPKTASAMGAADDRAIRKAAIVSAMIATDSSLASRAPADTVTTKPTATAVLSEDSPARAPPAAP